MFDLNEPHHFVDHMQYVLDNCDNCHGDEFNPKNAAIAALAAAGILVGGYFAIPRITDAIMVKIYDRRERKKVETESIEE